MRGGVLLGVVAAVWPLVARAVVLDRVRVRAGAEVVVELSTSGPVVPWVRRLTATADTPHRIYIDLADTVLAPAVHKMVTAPAPGLVRVRTGQFTSTTARIVLDTTAEFAFDVTSSSRRVSITLHTVRPAAAPPAAPPPSPPAPPPAATAPRPAAPTATSASTSAPAPTAGAVAVALPQPNPVPDLPLVVVDAGHGGHDPGAEGAGGIQEKTVVLQIAHRLAAKLPARLPVDSLLTRSDDSFVALAERLPHRDRARTIFLSLHANACDQPEPNGLEVFFGGPRDGRRGLDAKRLARLITTELRARLLRVRGHPRPGPFRVLTSNQAPSVLIELGYLTHRQDAARLQDAKYQELLTDAMVDAIAAFLQTNPDPSVHTGQALVPSGERSRTISARTTS